MTTRTITHEITFSATPREVYEALLDPLKHSKITGASAVIERMPGGRFVQNGGGHWGTLLEFKQDVKIVQSWHAKNWPESHFSVVTFTLAPLADGRRTQLSLVQIGVPEKHFDEVNTGWQKFYWTKMAAYFREEKVAVVRRFVNEVKNKGNLDVIDELFAPDFVIHREGTLVPRGPAAPKEVTKNNIYRIKDSKIAETWTETSLNDILARLTSKQAMAA
jgi:uncharacterized protein YndB with AHSA1/START domain